MGAPRHKRIARLQMRGMTSQMPSALRSERECQRAKEETRVTDVFRGWVVVVAVVAVMVVALQAVLE